MAITPGHVYDGILTKEEMDLANRIEARADEALAEAGSLLGFENCSIMGRRPIALKAVHFEGATPRISREISRRYRNAGWGIHCEVKDDVRLVVFTPKSIDG